MSESLHTTKQVADMLGVSERTVLRWIHARRLEALRLSPRVLRIPASAVAAFTGGPASDADADPDAPGGSPGAAPSGPAVSQDTLRLRRLVCNGADTIERVVLDCGCANPRLRGDIVEGNAWEWSHINLVVEPLDTQVEPDTGKLMARLQGHLGARFDVSLVRPGEDHVWAGATQTAGLRAFCETPESPEPRSDGVARSSP